MNKVIIVAGPTAVGKSSLGIELAKMLNTEIISADSMQIYKNMDIGTAKLTNEEMQGIKHHLIDIVDSNDNYSVQEFQSQAYKIIKELFNKNKIPIIVGGTGLYIDSLTHDFDFLNIKPDYELRAKLETEYKKDSEKFRDRVINISPNSYGHLGINDMKKLIRAMEVYVKEDKIINYDRTASTKDIEYHLFVLDDDREDLYKRINDRVDLMLDKGLVDEVSYLLDNGLNRNSQSSKAIGYKEVIQYLDGEYAYEDMVELLKRNSRRYAKRQLTWFRRNEFSKWLNVGELGTNDIIKIIKDSVD